MTDSVSREAVLAAIRRHAIIAGADVADHLFDWGTLEAAIRDLPTDSGEGSGEESSVDFETLQTALRDHNESFIRGSECPQCNPPAALITPEQEAVIAAAQDALYDMRERGYDHRWELSNEKYQKLDKTIRNLQALHAPSL